MITLPHNRASLIAAVALALPAIAGCGGSSSPQPAKRAASVPAVSTTASAGPSSGSATAAGSTTGRSTSGPARAKRKHAAGATSSVRVETTPGSGGLPVAKVAFAAPGSESRTAFISSADAICRSFRSRARAIGAGATTLVTQETELSRLLATAEQSAKALTELSPPASEAPGLRRFATMTVASVIAFAEAQTRTSSTSETVGAQVEARDLADSARSSHDATAATSAARQLGLHVCGSSGSAWF